MSAPEAEVRNRSEAESSGLTSFINRGVRRRFFSWAVFLFLGWTLTAFSARAQDYPMFRGDPEHTGMAQGTLQFPLALSWRYATYRNIPGTNPASPVLTTGLESQPVVFFPARDEVASLRLGYGEARWFYPSSGTLGGERAATIHSTPLYDNGTLYVGGTNGSIYAIKANTGDLLWEYMGDSSITCSPILVNGQLFFGTSSGEIVGLDSRTGKPLRNLAELFKADDAIIGSLAYANNFLYFVSRDQSVYALDLSRAMAPVVGRHRPRVIRWHYLLSSPPDFASPVISGDFVYVVDGDSLIALNSARGRKKWTFQANQAIINTPAVTTQGIFFGTKDSFVYAIDNDGKFLWKSEIAGPSYSSPLVTKTAANGAASAKYAVVICSNRGFIYAFDTGFGKAEDGGKPIWIYKARPVDTASSDVVNIIASPIISNGKLYVLADDGSFLAFSPSAPDRTPPLVWNESPDRGSELSGRPPIVYMVTVSDDGSGIDPSTIKMTVDGQSVDATYDEYRGYIYYKVSQAKTGSLEPVQPLPSGRHAVHVELSDWMGNKATHDWTFLVNNNISESRQYVVPSQ